MKINFFVMLTVTFFCGEATAEWSRIGENNRSVAYIDPLIHRRGDTATYWAMFDYKATQVSPLSGRQYLSEKSQREMDCRAERERVLFFTWHSGQMGNGALVYTSNKPTNWELTSLPGSYGNAFWQYICHYNNHGT